MHAVPLAPRTTLELGGAARHLAVLDDESSVPDLFWWSESRSLPVLILGGGSNLVIGDDGWDGLVLKVALRGIEHDRSAGRVTLRVGAGESWDELVAWTVGRGWAGIECLSGIPGSVGATPIQNVGAYGQEVADVITAVHVWDRRAKARRVLAADECGFGYRDSIFRRDPHAALVLAVELALRPGGAPTLRYGELARALAGEAAPSLAEVRQRVLELRRGKSMVIDPDDPNRRSAGSFFTNPVVQPAVAEAVVELAVREGIVDDAARVPRFATDDGRVKIPAAWLIEASGLRKGWREGAVGISSRHALALVHHGGGSTAELLAFARRVRERVRERFGVELRPEPILAGAQW
ncbi:MAG: UDP-N-acetylmuramate dehydrogenase [Myxococcales bacterium]|nr:UDP-N-acetylmuramate dehydrogenase [Myxococcales bacterium]